ncbi:MAG: AraC family transcriptional regulator [Bacteroidales bacterium]|nr:AraC family transcriptional regulator [Bacteroidales bacterium]
MKRNKPVKADGTVKTLLFDFEQEKNDLGYIGEEAVILKNLHQFASYQEESLSADMLLLALCTKGRAVFEIDRYRYQAVRGELVLIRPGQEVRFAEIMPQSDGIGIGFTPKFIQSALIAYSDLWPLVLELEKKPCVRLHTEEIRSLVRIHRHLFESSRLPDHPFKTEMLRSLMHAMLYQVAMMTSAHVEEKPVSDLGNFELYYRFTQLVARFYRTSRSVAFYADKLYVSPKYLGVVVKSVSGRTANRWIDEYVTKEAGKMLRISSKSIREVADSLNFADASFFTKYFKKNAGITPKEYRAQYGR